MVEKEPTRKMCPNIFLQNHRGHVSLGLADQQKHAPDAGPRDKAANNFCNLGCVVRFVPPSLSPHRIFEAPVVVQLHAKEAVAAVPLFWRGWGFKVATILFILMGLSLFPLYFADFSERLSHRAESKSEGISMQI